MDIYYPGGIGIMPVYRKFTWRHYKVSIRLMGWRRVFPFMPYYNGTHINLALVICTNSGEKREFSYTWFLHRVDGKQQHIVKHGDKSFIDDAQYRITEKLPLPYLIYPDKYNLQISIYDKQENKRSGSFVVAGFTLIDRDTTMVKVLTGVGIGVILAIVSLLVAFIK